MLRVCSDGASNRTSLLARGRGTDRGGAVGGSVPRARGAAPADALRGMGRVPYSTLGLGAFGRVEGLARPPRWPTKLVIDRAPTTREAPGAKPGLETLACRQMAFLRAFADAVIRVTPRFASALAGRRSASVKTGRDRVGTGRGAATLATVTVHAGGGARLSQDRGPTASAPEKVRPTGLCPALGVERVIEEVPFRECKLVSAASAESGTENLGRGSRIVAAFEDKEPKDDSLRRTKR